MSMAGQQNTDRIMTTHVGSLPRPHDLLDMMKAHLEGRSHDEAAYHARVREAVAECVRRQTECGIDIVCDGEQSKSGFFTYARGAAGRIRGPPAATPHHVRSRACGVS
jgi:5-methyltetrahydropteroyltriglutamate--homocysteine methyltransferase